MTRTFAFTTLAATLLTAAASYRPAAAEEPKATGTVDIFSTVPDITQQTRFPGTGVILSQKAWEELAAAWGIKNPPKVDFAKELLLVGTWRGPSFKFLSDVKDGNLVVELVGDKDIRPGFRYRVLSLKRDGIKQFQGKDLPKAADTGVQPIERPTVDLSGDVNDQTRQKNAPVTGVITSQKEWDDLVKAWGIKDSPKVDFSKEILVVGVSDATSFTMVPTVKDGDLVIATAASKETRDGFRWKVVSVPREGLKTVNGKPLPRP
jgi:hypothetical protein